MSRKQLVVERARRIFGTFEAAAENLAPVLSAESAGLESMPLSLESFGGAGAGDLMPHATGAGGPDVLAGLDAMKKVELGQDDQITDQDQAGLEAIILVAGRPAILVEEGDFRKPPKLWAGLETVREQIKAVIPRVGRIEVSNNPNFEWLGTGFLAGKDVVITNRHVALEFSKQADDRSWVFRAPMGASLNLLAEFGSGESLVFKLTSIVGIHDNYDMAILKVEQVSGADTLPDPLPIATAPPSTLKGTKVYVIGYPAWDGRRNDPEPMKRIFADIYNVKRLQPGEVSGDALAQFDLFHDCSTLGGNSGSPVFDLDTHRVLGLHFGGRFLENNHAVPLWAIQSDDLVKRAGLNYQ